MDEDFYLNFIVKRMSNALTEEESQQLETWEAASEDNRRFVAETEEAWKAATVLHRTPEEDPDEEFAFPEGRMDDAAVDHSPANESSSEPQPVRKRPRPLFVLGGIAVVVLLLIVISLNYLPIDLLSRRGRNIPISEQMTTVAAVDKMEKVTLPDGSIAHIYPGSEIHYLKDFEERERLVMLEGEGFFEVDNDPDRPFRVTTNETTVQVLGTKFNVKTTADQATTTVQVLEGEVAFYFGGPKDPIDIGRGQAGEWNRIDKTLEIITPSPNDLAWYTRKLIFAEVPLKDAMPAIEKLYGVGLELKNPALENCTLSSTFDEQSLQEVLKELVTIFGLQALPKGENVYELIGGQC